MTTVLCTLYNSLYLDKGLVLYDSLCECAKDFKLYVLCMDDKCYDVLADLKQEHHIPVRLADFEAGDEALLEAKANRPMGEYCWTCSSSLIRYVLKHYNEPVCTYIDADMYFYSDPQILVDEMLEAGKSVMVVPHRFPPEKQYLEKKVGRYCVEFNTFLNTKESLDVLDYWRSRCIECCRNIGDGIHWGDQKYLDEIVDKFKCVHICNNNGAGVAPWNVVQYLVGENKTTLTYLPDGTNDVLVFYHFQGISYISVKSVNIGIEKQKPIDRKWVDIYYKDYVRQLYEKKRFLFKTYQIHILIQGHPAHHHRFQRIKQSMIGQWLLLLYKKIYDECIIVSL